MLIATMLDHQLISKHVCAGPRECKYTCSEYAYNCDHITQQAKLMLASSSSSPKCSSIGIHNEVQQLDKIHNITGAAGTRRLMPLNCMFICVCAR